MENGVPRKQEKYSFKDYFPDHARHLARYSFQSFTPFILQHLLTSTEIYEAVIQYLDWRTFGLFFAFPMLAFRAFFVGITKTRVLTASAITLASMNVLLNYLLIFGAGKIPALGISGAAMASTISELGGLFVLVIYTRFKIDKQHYGLFPFSTNDSWDNYSACLSGA